MLKWLAVLALAKDLSRNERGATLVEFSLVATIFISIMIGSVAWGIWLFEHNMIQHATFQAARCFALPPSPSGPKLCDPDASNGASYGVINAFSLMNITKASFDTTSGVIANYRCVTAHHTSGLTTLTSTLYNFTNPTIEATVCYPDS